MALTKKDIEKLQEEIIPALRKQVVDDLIAALQSVNGIELEPEDESEDDDIGDEDEDVDDADDDDVDDEDDDADEEDEDEDDDSDEDDDPDEDDEDEEDEDDESSEVEEQFAQIQEELNSIPDALFDQAKTDSAGTKVTEMRKELIAYLVTRGIEKKAAEEDVKALSAADVKSVYADFYARFLDTDGEVHDMDEVYKATRQVDGEDAEVFCCNGVPMTEEKTEFVCAVNSDITQAKPKPKRRSTAKKTTAKKTTAKKTTAKKAATKKPGTRTRRTSRK